MVMASKARSVVLHLEFALGGELVGFAIGLECAVFGRELFQVPAQSEIRERVLPSRAIDLRKARSIPSAELDLAEPAAGVRG